jgi:beta-glucosidase
VSVRRVAAAVLVLACVVVAAPACDPSLHFTQDEIDRARLGVSLPRGFLLGAGSSAYQVEGGNDNSDWVDWERTTDTAGQPHIYAGQRAGRAAGSWDLWPADVAALRRLGANAYRLSIEWSRLEPAEGAWDQAAADRYRAEFIAMRAAGITPFVTLYHYSLPRWFASRGGWEAPDALETFARFAERAGRAFGDLVDHWVTVNEPNALAAAGYGSGEWPPGVRDMHRACLVYATLIRAHGFAAAALRRGDTADADGDGRATQLGAAHNITVFQPASSSQLDRAVAGVADDLVNEAFPRAVRTGWLRIFLPGAADINVYVPELLGTFDYFGLNYYRRDYMRADLASVAFAETFTPEDRSHSDLDWENYPEGFYQVLKRYGSYGWPIYVTENGVADATDALRPEYLRAHFYALQRAAQDGVDVRGYFHWSLTDNFEWAHGFSARYGLYAIDFDDPGLVRRPRPSTAVFREIARGLGLTPLDAE